MVFVCVYVFFFLGGRGGGISIFTIVFSVLTFQARFGILSLEYD